MKINNIHIENFKGIEKIDLEFDTHFNVLIGENGAGKSSILDAISIGLGTFLMNTTASFGLKGTKSRPLLKDEIRKVIVSDDNIELSDVLLSGTFCIDEIDDCIPWMREQKRWAKNLTVRDAQQLKKYGRRIIENLHTDVNLPLFANHTTGRLWGQIYEKTKGPRQIEYEKTGSRLDGYYACLDPRSIDQKYLNWFKTYEDNILKFNKDRSLYFAFTNVITSMVRDWEEIHFHWGLDDLLGKNKEGKWVQLRNLSDGYKGIISLAADIAYRAIKLNPHLGERAVLDTEGIVLIDEIDMHLHPKWQRHIVEDLKRTFPKIQFIVTTHSPFIVQSLKKEEVISLDVESINEDPFTKSIEEIAEQDMDVVDVKRSQKFLHFQEVAALYFNLIEEGKNSESDAQTRELKEKLDTLELEFNDDPVYVALMQAERKTELP
ncbi:MAG: AAA family ATPase [Flavobacterium sp.]|jgi:predicted ATP-binding protein involved in virulence|uniref:AAA family ATPase n=1 Tax=Flavobacterium sp. TaxID=239 RepID=UPI003BA7A082